MSQAMEFLVAEAVSVTLKEPHVAGIPVVGEVVGAVVGLAMGVLVGAPGTPTCEITVVPPHDPSA